MKTRMLGQKLKVPAIGLGCMGMSEFYGQRDDVSSLAVLHRAVDIGISFFDTADMYGPCHNEELLGRFIKERGRNSLTLATKFGIKRDGDPATRGIDNSPEYIHQCCESSLKRLNTDYIDLYYVHRYNPVYPVEAVMETLGDLVRAGKIGHIGLSEVSPETLRRAHAVHPVTALQTEYSLWTREVEDEILPVCKELGVGFVAYSPLGRGFLAGGFRSKDDFGEGDARAGLPRFSGDNLQENQAILDAVMKIAQRNSCTPAQLSLAWLLAKDDMIVPIPGTIRVRYLEENAAAADLSLNVDDIGLLESLLGGIPVAGARYTEYGMAGINT